MSAARRIFLGFAAATVLVASYVGAYLHWRHANGQTFEEYQSYEPGMVAPEHAGEWYIGAITVASASGTFFTPLIWMDERWFKLQEVGE